MIPATTALGAPLLLSLMVTIVRFGRALRWQPLRKIHQKRGSPALSHSAAAQNLIGIFLAEPPHPAHDQHPDFCLRFCDRASSLHLSHFIFSSSALPWQQPGLLSEKRRQRFRACGLIEIIFAVLHCLPGSILP